MFSLQEFHWIQVDQVFDGAIFSLEWKEALRDKYVTAAPRPRTQSEQHYSDRKLQPRR
jgi:hypothetical protein